MNNLLRRIFGIREGEGLRASLLFAYIFLVIASLLIVKPVRTSLFMDHLGRSQLPYAYILVALSAAVVISFYSKWLKNVRLNLQILYTNLLSIAFLFAFWSLLHTDYKAGWFYYTLYVWAALFGVLSASQFWLLANYVFDAREAKRLFGFIGGGAISGGIFGGYLTNFAAPSIGSENMLLFCMGFLGLSVFIGRIVWERSARHNYAERLKQERRIARQHTGESTLKLLLGSRHLTYLAAIVGVGVVVATLVDYQFNVVASEVYTQDELTAFFGRWLSNLSIASLLVQLLLTGRVLRVLGVATSLLFLPLGILFGAASILVFPVLWSAVLIKVTDGGLKQSINKAGIELLAVPIPSVVKNQGKAFIDVFVDSFATGIGGLLLVLFATRLGLPIQYVSIIIIGFVLLWLFLITRVKREYLNSFRLALEKRSIDLADQNISLDDSSVLKNILRVLDSTNERHILYALQLIENVKNDQFIPYLKKLILHPSPEIKVQVFRGLGQYGTDELDLTSEAGELVGDGDNEVRIEAARYLFHNAPNGHAALQELLVNADHRIRGAALMCAAYECREEKEFREKVDMRMLVERFVQQSESMAENDLEFMKITLANVVGTANDPDLYSYLEALLGDTSPTILQAAIANAGQTRATMFVRPLVEHLQTNIVRRYAREALAEYGEGVMDILSQRLEDPVVGTRIRLGIPKVFALIGTQRTVDILMKNLGQGDSLLRYEVLRALNRLKVTFANLRFDRQIILSHILEETRYFQKLECLLHVQKNANNNGDVTNRPGDGNRASVARELLMSALEEKTVATLERVFRLLGLRYQPQDMYFAYLGITSEMPNLQANAIEFLDNILDTRLKKAIIPIVEGESAEVLADRDRRRFHAEFPTVADCIEFLLECDDNWLKVCTMFLVAEENDKGHGERLQELASHSDPIVRETARYCLARASG